ncbi:MAG: LPS export ABC transporter permease LptG [Rhodospirillaceae bacterium]|jgi:lipopolysaccharide export system permease protein|nr:LPS export ABC transporter permease LptG [Rhodospirillaceae bacterium]MBT7957463.1 LPS export ABC transporter permease LptG [Rhodospirillaceae bacterium]
MRLSPTLTFYIGRSFLGSFFAVFVVFLGIIFLFDTVELLRRASSHENVGLALVFQMGLMKLPFMAQQIFPFAVLFGGMASFWRLTRTSELVVTRAAGVSAWQFLLPVLMVALILGIIKISAFNPLASAMLAKYDRLNATHLKGQSTLLAVSNNGLWLRQASGKNQSVIHAPKLTILNNEISLSEVSIFVYEGADKFVSRIDAKKGDLEDGFWHLRDVWINTTDKPPKFVKEHWVETDITLNNIHESFSPPETMSFWDLPDFIANLERSGFSALRHRLYWHSLLSAPLLLCAMVLIAATFTLRQSRRGSATFVIVGGVLTGFLLFFFSDVIFALGLRESIPVVLAAWTPSGVSTLLGLAMVFHLEDG